MYFRQFELGKATYVFADSLIGNCSQTLAHEMIIDNPKILYFSRPQKDYTNHILSLPGHTLCIFLRTTYPSSVVPMSSHTNKRYD